MVLLQLLVNTRFEPNDDPFESLLVETAKHIGLRLRVLLGTLIVYVEGYLLGGFRK